MSDSAIAATWTCEECAVTVSWMDGMDAPALPANWTDQAGVLHCLGCQREMAAQAGWDAAPEGISNEERVKLRSHARIEFEVNRDPERPDNQIAKVCRTSAVAVRRARERIAGSPV